MGPYHPDQTECRCHDFPCGNNPSGTSPSEDGTGPNWGGTAKTEDGTAKREDGKPNLLECSAMFFLLMCLSEWTNEVAQESARSL